MDYYKKKLYVAAVDRKGRVVDKVERWQAHEKGILHRGFTAALFYQEQVILQHRKHPVFNGVYDLTCSSHPYYKGDILQPTEEAVFQTLKREWNIGQKDLVSPLLDRGTTYYKAKDPMSIYLEHEVCFLFVANMKRLPTPNHDFAYGFSLMPTKLIADNRQPIARSFAPWVPPLLRLL